MAGLKEIRRRIRSVENTKKITRAMKLVSASKLRKAQDAVTSTREYGLALRHLIALLGSEITQGLASHYLLTPHEQIKKITLVVVGGTRGLCGAFNSNINKAVLGFLRDLKSKQPNVEFDSVLVGQKPIDFFRRQGLAFSDSYPDLGSDRNEWPIDPVGVKLESDFRANRTDEVYLLYTRFTSAVSMKVTLEKLLPLNKPIGTATEGLISSPGVTLYEPYLSAVVHELMPRILRALVWRACLHTVASEQGSRMSAMDNATKNATELIEGLRLKRNKLRQSGITGEILDIIGGATEAG